MSSDSDSGTIKIRVRNGENEFEIDAKKVDLQDAFKTASDLFQLIGKTPTVVSPALESSFDTAIHIDSKASLPNIVVKLLGSEWGSKPRRLKEIKEQLEQMGMIYPKQSIAVSLLRLAKEGEIRRFKGDEGDYLYVGARRGN